MEVSYLIAITEKAFLLLRHGDKMGYPALTC